MSRMQIHRWLVTCDYCYKEAIIEGPREMLPPGWESRWSGQACRRDYCPECLPSFPEEDARE